MTSQKTLLILIGVLFVLGIGLSVWIFASKRRLSSVNSLVNFIWGIMCLLIGVLIYRVFNILGSLVEGGQINSRILAIGTFLKVKYWGALLFMIYGISSLYEGVKIINVKSKNDITSP